MQTQLFFNTIMLYGPELQKAAADCSRQEQRILDLMAKDRNYTPFEIQSLYNRIYPPVPVTSIRRAMTCLTGRGLLRKCDEMRDGEFGKKNHTWKKL